MSSVSVIILTANRCAKLRTTLEHLTPQLGEDDGVIVIEDGRIVALGKADEVEAPWDATVIGGPDFVAC